MTNVDRHLKTALCALEHVRSDRDAALKDAENWKNKYVDALNSWAEEKTRSRQGVIADAARYRWLKEYADQEDSTHSLLFETSVGEWDAAIDAAMNFDAEPTKADDGIDRGPVHLFEDVLRIASLEQTLREVRALIEPYTAIDSWMPMHKAKQAVQLIDAAAKDEDHLRSDERRIDRLVYELGALKEAVCMYFFAIGRIRLQGGSTHEAGEAGDYLRVLAGMPPEVESFQVTQNAALEYLRAALRQEKSNA